MLDFSQLDVDASVLWVPIGPSPLIIEGDQIYQGKGPNAGQVTDIAIDPAEATDNVIYISTNDGGIWRTEDAGAHWQQNMDDSAFSFHGSGRGGQCQPADTANPLRRYREHV